MARQMTIREAVGVFDDAANLEAAIDALQSAGFDRADLSQVAGEEAVVRRCGRMYRDVSEVEDDPTLPRVAPTSRAALGDAEGALIGSFLYAGAVAGAAAAVAAGNPIAAVLLSAAVGGSAAGVVGWALARLVDSCYAESYVRLLAHGGLPLWVHVRDAGQERRACAILSGHAARDVHVHEIALLSREMTGPAVDGGAETWLSSRPTA